MDKPKKKRPTIKRKRSIRRKSGWQPIETAPRDGTRVLLFVPHYGAGSGHWDMGWHYHFALNAMASTTHWMPLPTPPGEE